MTKSSGFVIAPSKRCACVLPMVLATMCLALTAYSGEADPLFVEPEKGKENSSKEEKPVPVVVAPPEAREVEPAKAPEGPISRAEFEQLRKENEELRKLILEGQSRQQKQTEVMKSQLENVKGENQRLKARLSPLSISELGPTKENLKIENNAATSRSGKLKIGGLLQVWYYSIQNDNLGWYDSDQVSGTPSQYSSNEVVDNDSFRIRRAQLNFTLDIHENITAYIMIDPAKEADSFPTFPTNQGNGISGEGAIAYNAGLDILQDGADFEAVAAGNTRNRAVRNGTGTSNRMLQDAYINIHGWLPHHDFTIGQFRRHLGEEATRDVAALDFIERSMITQPAAIRDMGVQVHGEWFNDRFHYWLGTFNGAGLAFESKYNRADDNDNKDFLFSIMGRPLWNKGCWGSLELGYSFLWGYAGESGNRLVDIPSTIDGLNKTGTLHINHYAYAHYRPQGHVRGWWLRGEYGWIRDRFNFGQIASFPGTEPVTTPAQFDIDGWNFSTGYKMSESMWNDNLCAGGTFKKLVLQPLEFVFRYDIMQNLIYQDMPVPTRRSDFFRTSVTTLGFNYYIKGHNAKIQMNYNWVDEDDHVDGLPDQRQVREVGNDNLIINFQIAW